MSHSGGLKVALRLALAGLVFVRGPPVLHAQTTSASVSGSVQDSQGGVLPGDGHADQPHPGQRSHRRHR